jgi:hypothetical protein
LINSHFSAVFINNLRVERATHAHSNVRCGGGKIDPFCGLRKYTLTEPKWSWNPRRQHVIILSCAELYVFGGFANFNNFQLAAAEIAKVARRKFSVTQDQNTFS